MWPVWTAEIAVDEFLNKSIFKLRQVRTCGDALLAALRAVKDSIFTDGKDISRQIEYMELYSLKQALSRFEVVLESEFQTLDIYLVSKKGGFDTSDLVLNGSVCFQDELSVKVPECINDIVQATRCLAFELPTAAGFHFHRANESVLRRYFAAVAPEAVMPERSPMGEYLNTLSKSNLGSPEVRAALRDLKDLHRNPLIHPSHSIETIDEAIDLMCSIRTLIGQMLKSIPSPQQAAIADLFSQQLSVAEKFETLDE